MQRYLPPENVTFKLPVSLLNFSCFGYVCGASFDKLRLHTVGEYSKRLFHTHKYIPFVRVLDVDRANFRTTLRAVGTE